MEQDNKEPNNNTEELEFISLDDALDFCNKMFDQQDYRILLLIKPQQKIFKIELIKVVNNPSE